MSVVCWGQKGVGCVRGGVRCVPMRVCGPVTAGSRPGHINFTPLRAGPGSPAVATRQWEADGPGWRPYGAGGGGAFLPPAARKPPACRPPSRAGAGSDTVTNVPQPAWSRGGGRAPPGREGVSGGGGGWEKPTKPAGCCSKPP